MRDEDVQDPACGDDTSSALARRHLTLIGVAVSVRAFMRKFVVIVAWVAATVSSFPVAHGAVIYRSNEGWSVEGDPASKVEGSAAEQMRKAEQLEAEGNSRAAYNAYRALVKRYGLSVL